MQADPELAAMGRFLTAVLSPELAAGLARVPADGAVAGEGAVAAPAGLVRVPADGAAAGEGAAAAFVDPVTDFACTFDSLQTQHACVASTSSVFTYAAAFGHSDAV